MLVGWSRALVLVAVAALIGNSQCFGNCASATCSSPKTPSNSCHHQKSSDKDTARCSHQHSELAAPEAGFAKIHTTAAIAILPANSTAAITIESQFLSQFNNGSPPGNRSGSTISVLRI